MKKLSVVSVGRNDDHGGRFLDRMFWSVRSLSEIARCPNTQIEYVFVEWNPACDVLPISSMEHLWRPLIHKSFSMRFINVPKKIHEKIQNNEKLPVFQMIAKNIGIRRASNPAILATTSDVIFSPFFKEIFANHTCDDSKFYRCPRYDVKNIIKKEIPYDKQIQYCKDNITRRYDHPTNRWELFTEACGDFTLASRKGWEATRGYLELPIFSIHIDSVWVLSAIRYGLTQSILPRDAIIYHVEHFDSWTPSQFVALQNKVNRNKIPMLTLDQAFHLAREIKKNGLPMNDENWGFGGEDFKEFVFK